MKIIAKVKFNNGWAYVLDKIEPMVYKRIGSDFIYGTNGILYHCYFKRHERGQKAFGGRKFDITLDDGEIVNCSGEWWDGNRNKVEKELGISLASRSISTKEELKKCYVFFGYDIDLESFTKLIDDYHSNVFSFIYDYRDYEKIIKYDDDRKSLWRKISKLESDKKSLIKEAKRLSLKNR